MPSVTDVALIGAAGVADQSYFTGTIDEVVIYDTALTAARVAAHFNAAQ